VDNDRGGSAGSDHAWAGEAFTHRPATGEVVFQGGDQKLRAMMGEEQYRLLLRTMERNGELHRHPEPLNEADAAVLRAALAPVLRDLAAAGLSLPDVREEVHEDREWSVCAFIRDPGGTGQGISVMRERSFAEQVWELAGQVQQWATDIQVDPERPSQWPLCPEHRRAHALGADFRSDTAVWVCPETDRAVALIGALIPTPDR